MQQNVKKYLSKLNERWREMTKITMGVGGTWSGWSPKESK